MESVRKAKERFAKYPLVVAKCSDKGVLYARCVLLRESSVKQGECAKEFHDFKTCLQSAAKDLKTRL